MKGIAQEILQAFPDLNRAQREAIAHTNGPLLIVAGPGSGKTLVLVLRALNLLLRGAARPSEILLCTFTEKAAFELRDRIASLAAKFGYQEDLSELLVGTIHGICNEFIQRYRHHTPLGNRYEVLDELTQLLFIFDHFDEIAFKDANGAYLGRWKTRWGAIQNMRDYFNKITEELINPEDLIMSKEPFLQSIGEAYQRYEALLWEHNRIDFAHQQKLFFHLLNDPEIRSQIRQRIRYILVDEYQDTNYIQEQLLLQLAQPENNLCVVGDEDQSLYRFRGATVRNILEFPQHFDDCRIIPLTINYRSHERIVQAYNKFMVSCDWSNPNGEPDFRYDKRIVPNLQQRFADYPAVFCIWGTDERDEAQRVADLIHFLRENRVVEDYSQVALLLHSVRLEHSGHYLRALEEKGIPAFAPRARGYFENEEVRFITACFALLLGWHGEGRGDLTGRSSRELASYVDEALIALAREGVVNDHPLARCLQHRVTEIQSLKPGETLDRRLADYFYEFLSLEPFASLLNNENRARNLAIFSQLLNVFQNYYHYTVITYRNREPLRFHFFNSFLRLLYEGGINEYEDPDQPFPKGHVQVMTIHQAKGLEFPVVIVGSLDKRLGSPKQIDRDLGPFYHRPPFEPEDRITLFDRMRLHYVAFSRAEKVLVLTCSSRPLEHFYPIWQGLPQWPYVRQDLLKSLFFRLRQRATLKKTFSFSGDLKVYETCPRQYQFFRFYEFAPARTAEIFFGALVHQTIEDIHRWVLDGKFHELTDERIRHFFDANFRHLASLGLRPLGEKPRESAFQQVMNYFHQNRDLMERVIETEVDVSVEKENYILVGKIDLLLGDDKRLELLDFKTQPKPETDAERLHTYYQQLCIYAHILETRYGKRPERLLLYWTSEPNRRDALMEFPYRAEDVREAGEHFDEVVCKILQRDFQIRTPPEWKVCQECDLLPYCRQEGIIGRSSDDERLVRAHLNSSGRRNLNYA